MLPLVAFPSFPGPATLAIPADSSLIVCFFPGVRGLPDDLGDLKLDAIRVREWCDNYLELSALGYKVVWISAQTVESQQEWAKREKLSCTLLSDVEMKLADTLDLPTIKTPTARVYERLTLISHGGEVTHVFYPVNPVHDIAVVMGWIKRVHA